ncbi:MAG: response regulator [Candidatus Korobacteraceae bacterium]|jgi:DNA-binding response OmpR family regulator
MSKLLLIDDDEQLRTSLAEYLSNQGFEVHQAGEREEAEALIPYYSYAIVITDISLTKLGVEGFDLLKTISLLKPRPKVIVMSGHGGPEHRLVAQDCGADLFLQKPFSLATLEKLIGECVGSARGESNESMHAG